MFALFAVQIKLFAVKRQTFAQNGVKHQSSETNHYEELEVIICIPVPCAVSIIVKKVN
jgi:hypothetical protein